MTCAAIASAPINFVLSADGFACSRCGHSVVNFNGALFKFNAVKFKSRARAAKFNKRRLIKFANKIL